MKMKRGTDHHWDVRRYKGDCAWYAHCKCGYQYVCSKNQIIQYEDGIKGWKETINWIAPYCPNCGARKKWYNEVPRKIF